MPRSPYIVATERVSAFSADSTRCMRSYWRFPSKLAAAEQLSRICGYNEPEQVKHDHVHLQVDSALIEQLRAGYAEMDARHIGEVGNLAGREPRGF